ncbi:germinal-center associated nuclear protein-like isoform X2 [Dermacentor variabilis]|uniref:germinal-center associated nuclear protein-like isoform X2 n=1 Tax=Dermacentor variabilis TaxID=34621 RepID=UPI003F5B6622
MFKQSDDSKPPEGGNAQLRQSTSGSPFALTASAAFSSDASTVVSGGSAASTQSSFGNANKLSFGAKWDCPATTAPIFTFGGSAEMSCSASQSGFKAEQGLYRMAELGTKAEQPFKLPFSSSGAATLFGNAALGSPPPSNEATMSSFSGVATSQPVLYGNSGNTPTGSSAVFGQRSTFSSTQAPHSATAIEEPKKMAQSNIFGNTKEVCGAGQTGENAAFYLASSQQVKTGMFANLQKLPPATSSVPPSVFGVQKPSEVTSGTGGIFGRESATLAVQPTVRPLFDNILEKDKTSEDAHQPTEKVGCVQPLCQQRRHGTKVTATPEEISVLTTLLCNQVPAELNDREVLLEHFAQFGQVERITCNLKRKCATIHFTDHHSAELAKKRGTIISKQFPPVEIFWCSKRRPSGVGDIPLCSSSTEVELAKPSVLERPQASSATWRVRSQLDRGSKRTTASHVKAGESADDPVVAKTHHAEDSLSSLLRQSAHSVGERFRVLDARDKIIRLRLEKQSDLATARATRGACPDMCPEKERYSRTDKKCLSSFEILPGSDGVMDHTRMVKEYSRSSADQEEPLAHELRPPHVLRHTMDYLLVHLMDSASGTAPAMGEWYDFIWNRTRAIRKDITQQHLCDEVCVALVEQCARFHIHCAAALCEEDMSAFDPKINNENLVKCLQTLKHFYYDLSLRGLRCPNEPEFRAYDVLLHLTEGDTIRQVQKLPAWVRWSAEVKRAVAAFAALNSNNYVRFFRVAAQAPYLAACLLHRYFGQVRLRALQTFLKAFCQPNHSEEFSLEVLGRQLGFDSSSEVRVFASALGLHTSEQALLLDRASQIQPELMGALPVGRSQALVESKRITSVGEVVNGGPLPPDPQEIYQPHDSFMLDGMLRPAAYDATDQVLKCWGESTQKEQEPAPKVERQPEPEPEPEPGPGPGPGPIAYPDEVIEEVLHALVEGVVHQELEALGQDLVLTKVAELTATALLEEETHQLSKVACREEYLRAEEQRLQEKLLAKRQAREDEEQAREQLAAEILREGLESETEDLCRGCHGEALGRWQWFQSELILASLLDEVPLEESSCAARDSLAEEWAQHEDNCKRADLFRRHSLLAAAFARWVEFCEREKRQRRARESFPAAPSMRCNLTDPSLKLEPSRPHKRARISWDCLSKGLGVLMSALTEELERAPLDLDQLLRYISTEQHEFPFKLVVCLPSANCVHSYKAQQTVSRVRCKLGCLPQLEDAKVETIASRQGSATPFCLTVVHGGDFSSEGWDSAGRPRLLWGTSALLLLLVDADEPKDQLERRLAETLRDASRLRPVPCVCVVDLADPAVIGNVVEEGHLRGLLPQVWRIFSCSRGKAPPRRVLEEAVWWCSQFRAVPPPLQTSLLRDFIRTGVYQLVFDTINSDLTQHRLRWQFPNDMIKLYNCTLDHLAAVAASERLLELSVVAPEIKHPRYSQDWNEPHRLKALCWHVKSLKLAEVCGETHDVATLSSYIEELCNQHGCLVHRKAALLRSIATVLEQHGESSPWLSSATPWVDVLQECFCHLLFGSSFEDEGTGDEMVVHYLPAELDQFNAWDTWVDITLLPSRGASMVRPPLKPETTGLQPVTPASSLVSSAGEQKVLQPVGGTDQVLGTSDSQCLHQFEMMLAHHKSLSASFSSQLETMLTTPSNVSTLSQEDDKENDVPCFGSTCEQKVEDMLAVLETRVQESRKSSVMFHTFAATVLKS